MPDGTLTFIRDGELFRAGTGASASPSPEKLSEQLGRPSVIEEVAWVRDDQFWAVRSGESATLALLTTGQLAMSPSFTARMIEGLRVSWTGIVAAETDRGVVFFDNGGRRALTFPNGRAVTWARTGSSPRWRPRRRSCSSRPSRARSSRCRWYERPEWVVP